MKITFGIVILVITSALCSSCNDNEEPLTLTLTEPSSIGLKYAIDEESIIEDSLNNPDMDSLIMLFGEWQLVKICDYINRNIITDNNVKFIKSMTRQIYRTDTTHFQNQECYINEGDITLVNGILTEYYGDDSELHWSILKLNNRQLVVTDKSRKEPSTYYYLKMKGYNIN
jgi:hypothetical protein